MKLLLFSDVHCSQSAVKRLIKLADSVDLLIGAGDFGTMRKRTAETLAPFQGVAKPLVVVPGNAESVEELSDAVSWEHGHVLHGNGVTIEGVDFYGVGGGIPVTPFGSWSYDFSEQDAENLLASCPKHCVLVVHSPPYGAVDVSSRGVHLGSQSIRDAVDRCRPTLTVCGHIHDSAGRCESIDDSPIINAGPDGILWDLENALRLDP